MPDNKDKEYTGKVIKKLLPDRLNGKSYKKSNNNIQWIVIHNMGNGTNQGSYNHWVQGAGGANTSAHYCVDDKEIWQTLEDKWTGYHAGRPKKGQYGADRGASNNNSIGIEVADYVSVNKDKAVELAIELARYLVKKYGLSVDNVIQHFDVSGKDCPQWIRANNKWNYIKQQIKLRNEEQRPISFDPSTLDSSGSSSASPGLGESGDMPNFDNRENLNDIEKVRGVVLVNMPPYHFYSVKNKEEAWLKQGYSKEFHYLTDSSEWTTSKETNLIAMSLQPNDRHTYIDRALFGNKSYKYTLNVGLFTSRGLKDYTVTERILIDNIARVLYDNGLKTKHLWREFDLNRAPSPFMYLDREQWKLFLREVDKQVEWRYANFGEPKLPEEPPLDADNEKLLTHIGKTGNCNKRCSLRKQPNMFGPTVKTLEEGTPVKITDYNDGFYKVEAGQEKTQGWIVYKSITVNEDGNTLYDFTPRDKKIPKPEIVPTMTHKQYEYWVSLTDPKVIDEFAAECEPYDKGLPEILDAPIKDDERLTSLTKEQKTRNENTIFYSVIEGSPGGSDHCVKPASELSSLYKPDTFKVDPIYPDLVVPPNYSTTEYNISNKNPIPLTALENGTIKEDKDFNNLTFDFDLLKEMNKKSKGKPVNYLDAYPYDDKIYELEKHSPKVKIDEIESRLYECNHPGCPIAQPMAKNFAMLNDMALNQSKKVESRLVRLENTLSFVLRNLGRVGSRINVNCVYYGGQDTFGKYKTIRCLRDDRIHDACSVTLDQCLSCTRYEPIVGQIYEILDDTGMNGSTILDTMQMSYMNKDNYKAFNRVEEMNVNHKFANVNKKETDIPKQIFDEWEEEDKKKYMDSLKSKITDEKEYEEKIKAIKKEDYAFIMNWYEQDLDYQEPDVKQYPTEGIKAKYKNTDKEEGENTADTSIDTNDSNKKDNDTVIDETDTDYQEDLDKLDKLNKGEWVDTREKADTFEENKYTSEDYYFEDFNKDMPYLGEGDIGGIFGSEVRNKIVEMAKIIVDDHKKLMAAYDQNGGNRTINYDKKVLKKVPRVNPNEPIAIYDCSSFTSCAYNYAGLKSIYGKTSGDQMAVMKKGKTWPATLESSKDALPGDLIWHPGHIGIYIGEGKVAHSANSTYPDRPDIRIDDLETALKYSFKNNPLFGRPKDLIEADEKAAAMGGNVNIVNGKIMINGKEYPTLAEIKGAVCTPYHANTYKGGGGNYSRTGQKYLDIVTGQKIKVPKETQGREQIKYCASHNLPYGTQVFVPALKEKGLGNGILMVVDTGGHVFDFDINMNDKALAKFGGKQKLDVYVLKWGEDSVISPSYVKAARFYSAGTRKSLSAAWRAYMEMGGKLIKFHKFNREDMQAKLNSTISPID